MRVWLRQIIAFGFVMSLAAAPGCVSLTSNTPSKLQQYAFCDFAYARLLEQEQQLARLAPSDYVVSIPDWRGIPVYEWRGRSQRIVFVRIAEGPKVVQAELDPLLIPDVYRNRDTLRKAFAPSPHPDGSLEASCDRISITFTFGGDELHMVRVETAWD
jgi:hypothetical protein